MTTPYINVVAVKRDNADSPWAQDIVSAYKSPTFKNAILSDRFYDGFTLPDYRRCIRTEQTVEDLPRSGSRFVDRASANNGSLSS